MITSTANEKVKFVKKLHDKKNRDAENLFIAEGVNILSDLKEGFSVKEIFATDKTADIAENLAKKYGACTTLVSESVMKVLADTVSPSGILAVIGIPLSKPEGKNAVVLDGCRTAATSELLSVRQSARDFPTFILWTLPTLSHRKRSGQVWARCFAQT